MLIPNVATTQARIKVEAVGNVFFDVSNADFTIEALPKGHYVKGDGDLELGASAGTYPGEAGSKAHFHVDLKYNPDNLKDLEGNLTVHYKNGKQTYELKTKDWSSLTLATQMPGGGTCTGNASPTCWHLADLRSTATLTDTTKKKVVVGSNLTLRVTVTDRGGGRAGDSIGITLWDGSTLVFSSDWTGSSTAETTIERGKINVH